MRDTTLMVLVGSMVTVAGLAAGQTPAPAEPPAVEVNQPPAPGSVPLAPEIERFTVRAGFKVTLAADAINAARFLEVDDKGTLYVSRPALGDIIALSDKDKDGYYESRTTFVSDHPSVQSMQWRDGELWIATSNAVKRVKDEDGDGIAERIVDVIPPDQLPGGGTHWWRSLLVTDDAIYTSIGDSGNITDETTTDRQKIWKYNLDGTNKTLFASGIRNTEELRLRPGSGDIYGFDHGSDSFGMPLGEVDPASQPITDLNPADEFNRYVQDGFYGHPFLTGNRVPRIEYLQKQDLVGFAVRTIAPELCLPAHVAPNGFAFIEAHEGKGAMPREMAGDALVALHGSWNSMIKVGYSVSRVVFDNDAKLGGKPLGMMTLVSTLRPDPLWDDPHNAEVLARPVDVVQAKDGTVLFSSDTNGRVYRIEWVGAEKKVEAKGEEKVEAKTE